MASSYPRGRSARRCEGQTRLKRDLEGRKVAQRRISEKHVLRVIYEEGEKQIGVVTFYRVGGAVMRVRYNRKEDILILELSKASIDHAEEAGPIIAHFSTDDKLVLLEILEASDFLAELTKATMKAEGRGSVEL